MNKSRTVTTAVGLTLAVISAAIAQSSDTDAKAIWNKALAASRALKSIKFTIVSKTQTGQEYRATVQMQRADVLTPGPLSGKYVVLGQTSRKTGGMETFAYSYDGKTFRYRAGDGKPVEAIENPAGSEIAMTVPFEQALVSINPLELARFEYTKLTYVRRDRIADRDCDVIEVHREVEDPLGNTVKFVNRWGIDRKSGLPVYFDSDRGSSKTIVDLDLDPKIDPDMFKLEGKEVKVAKRDALAKGLLDVGARAPAFKVKDSKGRTVSLQGLKGKVVLLDFWGTWCQPCLRALPELKALHDKYKGKGLAVVSMAVAEKQVDPAALLKRKGCDWTSVRDGDPVAKAYKAALLPTLYLIGKDGRVLFRVSGVHESTRPALDALIAKNLK